MFKKLAKGIGKIVKSPISIGAKLGGVMGAGAGALVNKNQQALKAQQAAQQQANQSALAREQQIRNLVASGPEFQSSLNFAEFDKFKDFAYGTEDSPYAALQRQRIADQTSQGLDQAAADSSGAMSNIYSQLAMGGGLSGGARERMAGNSIYQDLAARQNVRRQGVEGERDLDQAQNQQRMTAQERFLDAQRSEKQAQRQFELDKWQQQTATEAALQKAAAEREIAAANSCLLEGTMVKLADGSLLPIENIEVGDELPGGIVYTLQKSMAPDMLYDVDGVLMTGGHAVATEKGWVRAKDVGELVNRPAGKGFIFNLGVTKHFIELAGDILVGDLHETDMYEYISDEESLEKMNENLPLRQLR